MQNKTALIVDDSRTAGQVLRRMLEKEEFQFQVDVLESAESAIVYLRDHRPGIIFMDHMMPGMDGFEAVKEIKGNSATAGIPIVMYTAKSGDLYVGQAQALGAVDILSKPPTRDSLRAVFRRIDERAEAANEPHPAPTPAVDVTAEALPYGEEQKIIGTPAPAVGEAAAASREVERPAAGSDFLREAPAESDEESGGGRRLPWWLALAATVLAFAGGMQIPRGADSNNALLEPLAWAMSQGMDYPYGEAPFAGARLERTRGLLEHLVKAGFTGEVKLQAHTGVFCLVADSSGWKIPDAALGIERCDIIGPTGQEARRMSGMQSPEFREFLRSSPALAGTGIRVSVSGMGERTPKVEYPPQGQVSSAGDWNRIASENNRIDVVLVPQL